MPAYKPHECKIKEGVIETPPELTQADRLAVRRTAFRGRNSITELAANPGNHTKNWGSMAPNPRRGGGRTDAPPTDPGGTKGSGKFTGTVKRWNNDRGFGFIHPDTGGDDVFCHANNITDGNGLQQGTKVTYDSGVDERSGKVRADNVAGGCQIGDNRGGGGGGGGGGGSSSSSSSSSGRSGYPMGGRGRGPPPMQSFGGRGPPPMMMMSHPPPMMNQYGGRGAPPPMQQHYQPRPQYQQYPPQQRYPPQQQRYPPPQQQRYPPQQYQQPRSMYPQQPMHQQQYAPPQMQQHYQPRPQYQMYAPPPQQQQFNPFMNAAGGPPPLPVPQQQYQTMPGLPPPSLAAPRGPIPSAPSTSSNQSALATLRAQLSAAHGQAPVNATGTVAPSTSSNQAALATLRAQLLAAHKK
jgi:cold shock CspA family protein